MLRPMPELVIVVAMDWVCRFQPLLVVRLSPVWTKLLMLRAIEVVRTREQPYLAQQTAPSPVLAQRDDDAQSRNLLLRWRAAMTPPLDPSHFAGVQRSRSTLAITFHIIGYGMRRSRRVRGGQPDNQQALFRGPSRFSERLSKGEVGLKASCRQIALIM
jgi:hypothetical protein